MVNRFCYDMHALLAWTLVFEALGEDDKFVALYEFVSPLAADCLSMPYSIKQMLLKSICNISHQTNRFRAVGWSESELKPDRKLQFDDAKKLAAHFQSWPAVCDAFSRLNHSDFAAGTDDYRNRLNHGFPRRIELGHTMTLRRDPDPRRANSFVYKLYDARPLRIGDLIPLLAEQYQAAVDCYRAYIELVREQHSLWPRLPGNST
jgi:hypothetical protein